MIVLTPHRSMIDKLLSHNNSVALANYTNRERPTLVGEVSVNVCGKRVSRGQHGCNVAFLDWSRYFSFQVQFLNFTHELSGPRSRPTTSQKIW
jgi:hypothetical protein